MRLIFLMLFVLSSYSVADEISRIESIVEEIEALRVDYRLSQKELKKSQKRVVALEKREALYKKEIATLKKKLQNSQSKKEYKSSEIEYTRANTFRTNREATIYDSVAGNEIEKWEAGRSFTSNKRAQEWIEITGYFVNKIWQPSKRALWIKAEDAYLREPRN